ncbi:flagellar export protein FliJ [Psychromonas sp. KJ10-10]|uniref:flagellar export protein FliJ n=1 Tax=Psychromonas sp. KJ10-10 TaxID=3391823 RepID=UPI0039B3B695
MAKNALQLVFEQRKKQVEQALQTYQQSQKALFEQRQQLQSLHQYRRQYINQLSEKGSQGLSISDLGKYQQFIVQIDKGVTKHQQGLVKYEHAVHRNKNLWIKAQVNCKAMGMLLDNKAKKEALIVAKKEQLLLDEFATFQHFQKQSGL